jgi:hypothetical protein
LYALVYTITCLEFEADFEVFLWASIEKKKGFLLLFFIFIIKKVLISLFIIIFDTYKSV